MLNGTFIYLFIYHNDRTRGGATIATV